jgi:hypothetical protein
MMSVICSNGARANLPVDIVSRSQVLSDASQDDGWRVAVDEDTMYDVCWLSTSHAVGLPTSRSVGEWDTKRLQELVGACILLGMDVEMHIALQALASSADDVVDIRGLLDTDCIETMTKYLNRDSVAALANKYKILTDAPISRFTPGGFRVCQGCERCFHGITNAAVRGARGRLMSETEPVMDYETWCITHVDPDSDDSEDEDYSSDPNIACGQKYFAAHDSSQWVHTYGGELEDAWSFNSDLYASIATAVFGDLFSHYWTKVPIGGPSCIMCCLRRTCGMREIAVAVRDAADELCNLYSLRAAECNFCEDRNSSVIIRWGNYQWENLGHCRHCGNHHCGLSCKWAFGDIWAHEREVHDLRAKKKIHPQRTSQFVIVV